MKFTQIPTTAMEEMQLNAGVLLSSFTPSTAEVSGIIGATTGGIKFSATPTYSDFGEDIDNCPKNMMELKRQESVEVKISSTFVTITTAVAKKLMAAADIDTSDQTKIKPRNDLKTEDFADIWWVGDYSDKNGTTNGGFVAIHVMNALNTGGFQLQTGDKSKGQFPFEFTGHYSMDAQDVVPYEVYIKAGTAEG